MQLKLSNEVLAGLLFVAIVISLIGTFGVWSKGFISITGFQSDPEDTATASFEISEITAINWTSDALDWGTGSVDVVSSHAELNSNHSTSECDGGTDVQNASGWLCDFDELTLQNIGNKNINVTLSSDMDNASLTGGTNPSFQWYWWEIGNNCYVAEEINFTSWTEIVKDTNHTLCKGWNFSTDHNNASMEVKVIVPVDAAQTGTRTATFVAFATSL